MADDATATADAATDTAATDQDGTQAADQPTLEEIQAELKKARAENAGLRGHVKKLTDAQQEAENAKLTEQERITKERDDYKAALEARDAEDQKRGLREQTKDLAYTLGFADPSDAYRLLDMDQVALDADGNATNLKPLLEKLLEDKPYMKGKVPPPPAGGDGGARGGPAPVDGHGFMNKKLGA